MATYDSTLGVPLKQCCRKDKCANPQGPWLPATTNFFSRSKSRPDGLAIRCKSCDSVYYESNKENISRRRKEQQTPESKELAKQRFRAYQERVGKDVVNARSRARRQRPEVREKIRARNTSPEQKERKRLYNSKPEQRARRQAYNQRPEVKERARERQRRKRANAKSSDTPAIIRDRQPRKSRLLTTDERHLKRLTDKQLRARRTNAKLKDFSSLDWKRCLAYFKDRCAVCGRDLSDPFGDYTASADHWIPISSADCPGTIPSNIVPLCHGKNGCNNSKHNRLPIEWLVKKFGESQASEITQRIEAYFNWLKSQGFK